MAAEMAFRENWFRNPVDARVLRDDAAFVGRSVDGIHAAVNAALRTRSWGLRRVLAMSIDPEGSFEALLDEVRSVDAKLLAATAAARSAQWVRPEEAGRWWSALAYVVGMQGIDATDHDDACRLFDVARELLPLSIWTPAYRRAFAQLRWAKGHHELADDVELLGSMTKTDRSMLELDILARETGVGSAEWVSALNAQLARHGVKGVALDGVGETPFDRLSVSHEPAAVDGPLITVIMSAYRPGPEIFTAVRSVLQQSWRNIELFVVDDASGPEFDGVLDRVAALDARVRVVRQPVNGGTYVARNTALALASGELVTFQDSDDWTHPERLERQARPLLADPNVSSTMSRSIRCTPDMSFNWIGYSATRVNVSSIMYRRAVHDVLGAYDTVRKSGDIEFDDRIKHAIPGAQLVLKDQLAFVRLDPNSLSRSDFTPGWQHPARHEYRESFYYWQRQVDAGRSPRMEPDMVPRPFPAPRRFLSRAASAADDRAFDVVFVGDWRRIDGAQRSVLAEIASLAGHGLRLGVMSLEALRLSEEPAYAPTCDAVRELIAAGVVEAVLPDDTVDVRMVMIRRPDVLVYPSVRPMAFDVDEVVVLADQRPRDLDGSYRRYIVEDVDRTIEAVFGTLPVWVPQSPVVRADIEADVEPSRLLPTDLLPTFDTKAPMLDRTRFRSDRPVIGRLSNDDVEQWPQSSEQLLEVYPDEPSYDVRVMGGARSLRQILPRTPRHWILYERGEIPSREFLFQLDFFVYFHHASHREAFPYEVLEAIAAGCVVILPHYLEPVFGRGAIYCEPGEVRSVVARMFADRSGFAAQVTCARNVLAERFGADNIRQFLQSPIVRLSDVRN